MTLEAQRSVPGYGQSDLEINFADGHHHRNVHQFEVKVDSEAYRE